MVGELEPTEIEQLLLTATHGFLGCQAPDETYVVPISFAYDGARLVGFTTAGKKIAMMRANSAVSVAIAEIKDLTHWSSVIVNGKFTELHGADAAVAVGLLIDKYGPLFEDDPSDDRRGRQLTPPTLGGEVVPRVVYAIEISAKSGRYERPA